MSRKLPIQILITSLLLIFVFNNFGYWFCFKVEQGAIKEEMYQRTKQSIPNSQLISISISADYAKDLAWTEDGEFTYKGEMYDVVRSEKGINNAVTYYCLDDAKEGALLANLSSHLDNNVFGNKTSGKHSNDLLKIFSQTYFNNIQEFHFFNQASRSFLPMSSIIYNSIQLDILCPPPDRIS